MKTCQSVLGARAPMNRLVCAIAAGAATFAGPALAGLAADLLYIPHYQVGISDTQNEPITEFGGAGGAVSLELAPDDGKGWVGNAAYDYVDGGALRQLRSGLGRQFGGRRIRAALFGEYVRIDLGDDHIDGIGLQVRVNFDYFDPLRVAAQIGHRCLKGELALVTGAATFQFDLNDYTVQAEYAVTPGTSVVADAQWTREVISMDYFGGSNYRLGMRWRF